MAANTTQLFTTIKNVSSGSKYFGFIPPHGKTLASGESVTLFGDIWDQIQKGGRNCARLQASLEAALLAGTVVLTTTPKEIVFDTTANKPKSFDLINSVFQANDPTWGSYTGAPGATGTTGATGAAITPTGPTGPTGPGYAATSTTSLLIGNGSKVFTTQAGLAYSVGARVRASSAANGANFMEGLITAYSSTSMTVNVTLTGGSGTLNDWNINIAGEPGV